VHSTCRPRTVKGAWRGKLKVGPSELTLVIHIDKEHPTLDSPDQGATDIPAVCQHLSADSVALNIPLLGAKYTGRLHEGRLHGTFQQMGKSFNLVLEPGQVVRNRPQTPQPPFPYSTQEVHFQGANDSVSLAGTLTFPVGYAAIQRPPVVVFVSGSGPQNRDEELFEHRPFLVFADFLARQGIASLRYDDRGTAQSTGDFASATTKDFAGDAASAVRYVRSLGQFGAVGIVGHSEGGQIAIQLASSKIADFIVTLAAPAIKGDSLIVEQNRYALRTAGLDDRLTVSQWRQSAAAVLQNAWYRAFADYDPAADIARVACPTMALYGTNDRQVFAESNVPAFQSQLPRRKENVVRVYEGLNHLFQHAPTGAPTEYAQIDETLAPEVLTDVADWINRLTSSGKLAKKKR